MLELKGTIVSIDRAPSGRLGPGCQRKIAAKIVQGGGDYVLQVKGNQPSLQAASEASFAEASASDHLSKARRHTTNEKSRGRRETRHYTIMAC